MGKKKKCRVCGEEFSVEPLSCPKCGTRVNTHKAEKWGAIIGAFAGSYFSFYLSDYVLKLYIDMLANINEPYMSEVLTPDFFATMQSLQSSNEFLTLWWKLTGEGLLVGLIGTFIVKKIVFAIKKHYSCKESKNERAVQGGIK